jgi:lipopolysaccharide transport system permease protein
MSEAADGITSETPPWERPGVRARRAGLGRSVSVQAGLVWTLVRTDFKARYHGTLSGFAWALLKPMCMFAVLMGVFSFLFPDPRYKLNLIIGLILWDFFAESTKTGLTSLHAKSFLLTKARCPLWVLVMTSMANALITLSVFIGVILAFLVATGRSPGLTAFALFVSYCFAFVVIVAGFSLASSVLFLRYRDLNQVWDVVAQAGFFLAPIIYPLGIMPERFHFYLYVWPPTPVIEFSRAVLLRHIIPTRTAHAYLALEAVVALLVGIAIFRRLAPAAAEHV